MPTRERRIREAKRAQEDAKLDAAMANPPQHIKNRMTPPAGDKIRATDLGLPAYLDWGGLIECPITGELGLSYIPSKDGGGFFEWNQEKMIERDRRIRVIQRDYGDRLEERGVSKQIAHGLGVDVRTIQRDLKAIRGTGPSQKRHTR